MSARIQRLAIGTALILVAACGRSGGEDDANQRASASTSLDRAVEVARALQTHPSASDSILAAHGLTQAGFNALMYEIAADSALARAYTEAIR